MTEQELQIGLCKVLGWKDFKTADRIGLKITKCIIATNDEEIIKGNEREKRGLPNWPYKEPPPLTLDLCHEVEKVLTPEQRIKYAKKLDWVCSDMLSEPVPYSGETVNWPQAFDLIHIDKLQRATALLQILNPKD